MIEISPNEPIKIEDLGYSISNFRKEQSYSDVKNRYIYHNKNFGIAFDIEEGEIQMIFLFPSNSYKSQLCNNEAARDFYSSESWFGKSKLEERTLIIREYPMADVKEINLSESKIIIGCSNPEKKGNCSIGDRKISVNTTSVDPDNDVLTYVYKVSGGKIVGTGAEVVWDLSGVKPGTYTITAGVDDGCGVCGKTVTKTVTVEECPDCSKDQITEPEKP